MLGPCLCVSSIPGLGLRDPVTPSQMRLHMCAHKFLPSFIHLPNASAPVFIPSYSYRHSCFFFRHSLRLLTSPSRDSYIIDGPSTKWKCRTPCSKLKNSKTGTTEHSMMHEARVSAQGACIPQLTLASSSGPPFLPPHPPFTSSQGP